MGNSYVPVLEVTSGPNVDTSELTVDGVTVERQRMVIADDSLAAGVAEVNAIGQLSVQDYSVQCLLTNILVELRVCTAYLQNLANSRDDPATLRQDFANPLQ